ncbi:MAG: hypothetical protein V4735_06455 [Pseudomonadota bacterium]
MTDRPNAREMMERSRANLDRLMQQNQPAVTPPAPAAAPSHPGTYYPYPSQPVVSHPTLGQAIQLQNDSVCKNPATNKGKEYSACMAAIQGCGQALAGAQYDGASWQVGEAVMQNYQTCTAAKLGRAK